MRDTSEPVPASVGMPMCDHIEHVRTQMPYAMLAAIIAIIIGTVPAGFGFPPVLSIVIGIAALILTLQFFGRKADDPDVA